MRNRQRLSDREVAGESDRRLNSYNYYGRRAETVDQKSKPIREKPATILTKERKTYFKQRIGLVFLLGVLFICMVWILKLGSNPTINLSSNNSTAFLKNINEQTQNRAHQLFQSSVFNTNKITVNSSYITDQLKQEFPEYDEINISLPLLDHEPVLNLISATPTFVLNSNNNKYLISARGAAILKAEKNDEFNYLNLGEINDLSGYDVHVGSLVLTQSDVAFLNEVLYQLKAKNIEVSHIDLPAQSREADFYIKNKNYYVKFNLQDNKPVEQAGTYLAAENYTKSHNINVASYYDVRVPSRVYIK